MEGVLVGNAMISFHSSFLTHVIQPSTRIILVACHLGRKRVENLMEEFEINSWRGKGIPVQLTEEYKVLYFLEDQFSANLGRIFGKLEENKSCS